MSDILNVNPENHARVGPVVSSATTEKASVTSRPKVPGRPRHGLSDRAGKPGLERDKFNLRYHQEICLYSGPASRKTVTGLEL